MAEHVRIGAPVYAAVRELPAIRVSAVPWYVWSAALAVTSTTVGLYWDISWHIGIGRDTFWTPAHLAIQFGAVLTGFSCAYLILHTTCAGQWAHSSQPGADSACSPPPPSTTGGTTPTVWT